MKTALDYVGQSKSFKELDLLLTSTSGLGEGFIEPIRSIFNTSFYVDKEGIKEKAQEKLKEFKDTFTNKIKIFSPDFIEQIYVLIEKGIEEQCEIYSIEKI